MTVGPAYSSGFLELSEATTPMKSLAATTPLKLGMGLQSWQKPWKLRQLRQTSCMQRREAWSQASYQLLQALTWQKSMEESASCTMGTKQLKGRPWEESGSGTATPWQIVISSALTIRQIRPIVFSCFRRSLMSVATCLGVGRKLPSISRSTPLSPQVRTKLVREARKFWRLVSLAQTLVHWPLGPPTERKTRLPVFFQLVTWLRGQLSASMMTAPLGAISAQERSTLLVRAQTSSLKESPQQLSLKPQQAMLMMVGAATAPLSSASRQSAMQRVILMGIRYEKIQYLLDGKRAIQDAKQSQHF